jgi:hypothetical protein
MRMGLRLILMMIKEDGSFGVFGRGFVNIIYVVYMHYVEGK